MTLHNPVPDRAGASPPRDVYSVSRLNREVRGLLEGRFPLLWIEGEVSNLSQPSSGHWYFSLKDASAQVRCAMFRLRNMLTGFRPENGMQVLLRARIGLYEPRGEYQLIVESMEPAGDGALRQAFEVLKQRLAGEGLFDAEHKKPLPLLPRQIGIISSPTGAALRDILSVLQRRFPAIPVMIYPVPVQGAAAAGQIAATLRLAGRRHECDVLILARGGGSLEDLWAFNEEPVARAIFDCSIPVVTGIGHETDFTIADFVADQRAPTPSAAAELVSPDCQELRGRAAKLTRRLQQIVRQQFRLLSVRLNGLEKRLQHPGQRLRDTAQRLDELELRLRHAQRHRLRHGSAEIANRSARLLQHTPLHLLRRLQDRRRHAAQRLDTAMRQILRRHHSGLSGLARALDTVSPLATLERGYAIVRRPDGSILRLAADARPGDRVQALLAKGRINCIIEESLAEAATDNNEKPE